MGVGAPYSEPGSRRERYVIGLRRGMKGSDLKSAGGAPGVRGLSAAGAADWLSEVARESRGARPGLT